MKWGILITNLGTPKSLDVEDVGTYLNEFLMDPFVIGAPRPIRDLLVKGLIVPKRKAFSQEKYKKIWFKDGSPLLLYTEQLVQKVKGHLSVPVALGMRYQSPSLEEAVKELIALGVEKILTFPLYPQYAESTTRTTLEELKKVKLNLQLPVEFVGKNAFFDADFFLKAYAQRIQQQLDLHQSEHLLLSYHGLPVSHIHKTEKLNGFCFRGERCCLENSELNEFCYRSHCLRTTRGLTEVLHVAPSFVSSSFQSRLGRGEWLGPSTEETVQKLAQSGFKRLAVACPSFVIDCLETLEEIDMEVRETFLRAGGEDFAFVPALNAEEEWTQALAHYLQMQLTSAQDFSF